MGKKAPATPAAPDPVTTAAAQTQTNKDTAYWNAVLNNVNQVTPYGNLTFKQSGGGPQYDYTGYQKALDTYNASGANTGATIAAPTIGSVRQTGNQVTGYRLSNGQFVDAGNNPNLKVGDKYGADTVGAPGTGAPTLDQFKTGDTPPQFTSTVDLSPEQQALYNSQVAQQQDLSNLGTKQIARIQENANTPFGYGGIGNEVKAEDVATAQARAEEALLSRLNPQFGRDEEALRTRLINQGIGQGSEAYNREFEQFGQTKNDARQQAILAATSYGGDLQNQALARRNQAIQEYTTQRNAPLNEYIGFTSGTQVQNPQFQNVNYQGASPVDYGSLVNNKYQSDINARNAKVASQNANLSALGSLAGAGLSFGLGTTAAGGKSLFGMPLWKP